MKKLLYVIPLLVLAPLLVACGDEQATPTEAVSPAESISTPEREQVNLSTSVETTLSTPTASGESASANPTPTSTPTPTPIPTSTPEDGSTALPTAKPLEATPTPVPPAKVAEGPLAQELVGTQAWINSEPLSIAGLKGKVVLIDFWTYTCVNCIRTLPYLKVWHSKYLDDGLVIIGVHTPEFEHEKVLENVQRAVENYGVGWAVVQDNDFRTWRAYQNRYWPAKYLIDKDGVIRYTHFGEGAYVETELRIRELLEEAGADLSILNSEMPNNQPLDPDYVDSGGRGYTRELYAGHERGFADLFSGRGGYVGDPAYYDSRDKVVLYEDPGDHASHLLYLQGAWRTGRESLQHARETTEYEDYITLKFAARSVNAVMDVEGEVVEPAKVLVTLDGQPMTDENKGDDVVIEEDGRSFLYIDGPRMYSIVQAPRYGAYELRLSPNSLQFSIFAYTFGVYASGV